MSENGFRVVDGDTLWVPGKGYVRAQGFDSPEIANPSQGKVADPGAYRAREVANREVAGFEDTGQKDKYGRTIGAFVDESGKDLSTSLIERGYADPMGFSNNEQRAAEATRAARTAPGGDIWNTPETKEHQRLLQEERAALGSQVPDGSQTMRGMPRVQGSTFAKGVQRGMLQMEATGGALMHWGGEVFDSEWAQEVGLDIFEAGTQAAQKYAPEVGSHTNVEDFGDGWTFVVETIGEQLPNLLTMVAGAGVTGIAAKAAATAIGRKMVEKHGAEQAKRLIARHGVERARLAENAATFGRRAAPLVDAAADTTAKRAALTGAFGTSTGMNMGQTQGEFIEHGLSNPGLVLATGLVQGTLDTAGLAVAFGPVFKALSKLPSMPTKSMYSLVAKEAAKGFGKGFVIEGATEPLQEAATLVARSIEDPNFWMLSEEDREDTFVRLIDAALKGGIMGGTMMGGPAGVVQGVRMSRIEAVKEALQKADPDNGASAEELARSVAEKTQADKDLQEEIRGAFEEAMNDADAVGTAAELMRAGVTRSEISRSINAETHRILKGSYPTLGAALQDTMKNTGTVPGVETPMGPGEDVQAGPAVTGPPIAPKAPESPATAVTPEPVTVTPPKVDEKATKEAEAARLKELRTERGELNAKLKALSDRRIADLGQMTKDELTTLVGSGWENEVRFRLSELAAAHRAAKPRPVQMRKEQVQVAKDVLKARQVELTQEINQLREPENVARRARAKRQAPSAEGPVVSRRLDISVPRGKSSGVEIVTEEAKPAGPVRITQLGFKKAVPEGVISTHRKGDKNISNTEAADYGKPDSGWLGNPYLANDVKGGKLTREEAVAAYEKYFNLKVEADPEFKAAVLALTGKQLGYYKPSEGVNHVKVILKYLKKNGVDAKLTGEFAAVDAALAPAGGRQQGATAKQAAHEAEAKQLSQAGKAAMAGTDVGPAEGRARDAPTKAEAELDKLTEKFEASDSAPVQVVLTSPTANRVVQHLFGGETTVDTTVKSKPTWTVEMAEDSGKAGQGNASQGELMALLAEALNDGAQNEGNSDLALRYEHADITNATTKQPIQIWMNAGKLANLGRAMAGNKKETIAPGSTFKALADVFAYLTLKGFVFKEGRSFDTKLGKVVPVLAGKDEAPSAMPTGRAMVFKPNKDKTYSWRGLVTGRVLGGKQKEGSELHTQLADASVAAEELADAKAVLAEAKPSQRKAAQKRVDAAETAMADVASETTATLLLELEAETGLGELDVEHRQVLGEMLADGRYAQEEVQGVLEDVFSTGKEIDEHTGAVTPKAEDSDSTAIKMPTEADLNAQSLMSDGDGASGMPRNRKRTPKEIEAQEQGRRDQESLEHTMQLLAEGKNVSWLPELKGMGKLARDVLKRVGTGVQAVVLGTEGLAQLTTRLEAERGTAHTGIETTYDRLRVEMDKELAANKGKQSPRWKELKHGYKDAKGNKVEGEISLYQRVAAKRMLEDIRAAVNGGSPAWVVYGQHRTQSIANIPVIFIDQTRLKGSAKQTRAMAHELGHVVMRAEVEAEGRSATHSELRAEFLRSVPWAKDESAALQTELFGEWFAEMFAEDVFVRLMAKGNPWAGSAGEAAHPFLRYADRLPSEVKHSKGVQAFLGKLRGALRKLWTALRRGESYNETFSAFMRAVALRTESDVATRADGTVVSPGANQTVLAGRYGLSKEALQELSSKSLGLAKAGAKMPRYSNLAGVEKLRKTPAGRVLEAGGKSTVTALKDFWKIALQNNAAALDSLGLGSIRKELFANAQEAIEGRHPIPTVLRTLRGVVGAEIDDIAKGFGFTYVRPWYKLGLGHYDRSSANAQSLEAVLVDVAISGDESLAYAQLAPAQAEAFAKLRGLLDSLADYGENVGGLRIRRRKGYIPIGLDYLAIRKDEPAFLAVWQEVLQEVADKRAGSKGKKAHKITMAEAERAWNNLQGDDAALDNFGLAGDSRYANYGPALVHARQRGFSPEQWTKLRPWIQTDVISTVSLYAQRLQRRAEYQRRGGYAAKAFFMTDGEKAAFRERMDATEDSVEKARIAAEYGSLKNAKLAALKAKQQELEMLGINKDMLMQPTVRWQEMMKRKVRSGEMSPGDYNHVSTRVLPALMGTLGQHLHPRYRRVARALQMYQSVTLLTMGWFASVMDAGLLAWRVDDMRITAQSALEAMRKPKNMTREDRRAMYELIGTLNSAQLDHYLNSGAAQQQFAMGKANMMTEVFFRANFMHQWTEGLRLVGAIAAQKYMIKHADQALAGDAASAELLSHLGISAEQVLAVANRADGTLNFDPALKTSAKVSAAINTFVDQAILRPDGGAKPWWGTHPIGGVFFFLKTFMFLFQEIVLKSIWRKSVRQGKGKVLASTLHGFLNAAPLLAFIIPLTILGYELRRQLAGADDEDWFEQLDRKGPMGYAVEIAKRSGILGVMELGTHDVAGDVQRGKFPLTSVSGPTGEMFFEGIFGGGLVDPSWYAGRAPVFAGIPVARAKITEALGG